MPKDNKANVKMKRTEAQQLALAAVPLSFNLRDSQMNELTPHLVAPPVHYYASQIRVQTQSLYLRECGIAPSVPLVRSLLSHSSAFSIVSIYLKR